MRLVGHGHKSRRALAVKRNRRQLSQRAIRARIRNGRKRIIETASSSGFRTKSEAKRIWRKRKPRPQPKDNR